MTEEEAKTRPCPTIRYCLNETDVIQEGRPPLYAQSTCLGADCMAWRWAKRPTPERQRERSLPTTDYGRPMFETYTDPAVPGDGFCGLAGSPQ